MHKKLMLACMAIAAFAAFVIAPAASASPVLTENGVRVPATNPDGVNTKIIATNTGVTKFNAAITVECATAHLTGELLENTGTHIKGEVLAANAKFTNASGGDCSSNFFGAPAKVTVNRNLCLTVSKGTDNVVTDACGSKIQFTLELTGFGPCKYEQVGTSITSAFTTNASPVSTTLEKAGESKLIEGGGFCPSTGTLTMTFDLYTDVAEDTKFPLTIS
jgi:hypothetical protein